MADSLVSREYNDNIYIINLMMANKIMHIKLQTHHTLYSCTLFKLKIAI